MAQRTEKERNARTGSVLSLERSGSIFRKESCWLEDPFDSCWGLTGMSLGIRNSWFGPFSTSF